MLSCLFIKDKQRQKLCCLLVIHLTVPLLSSCIFFCRGTNNSFSQWVAHDLFLYEHRRSFILWQILTLRLLHEIWFKVSKVSILSKRYFSHSSLIFHYLSDIFSDLGRSIRDICGRCNRRKGIRVWIIADWYRIIPIVSAAARCFCHRVKEQERKKISHNMSFNFG